jgi:hypothetical protein
MSPSGYDGHIPVSRTKRLDERSFHKSESKLPLSLDMLDIEDPELLFELVPVYLGHALIGLFHLLPLSGSLLVDV